MCENKTTEYEQEKRGTDLDTVATTGSLHGDCY